MKLNKRILIVGQGLAGTLAGYRLHRRGCTVTFLNDPNAGGTASTVAAGIINPITGRRFVKSWRIDELLPVARALYFQLEAELGVQLWYDLPLLRTLFNRGDENDWSVRDASPGYAAYIAPPTAEQLTQLHAFVEPAFAYGRVRQTARVDLASLVRAYRQRLRREGRYFEGTVEPTALTAEGELPRQILGGELHTFDAVIFCKGWLTKFDPYFGYLPHGGAKGEVLIIRTAAPPRLDLMYKHRIFIVPQGNDLYWIGATNENRFTGVGGTAKQQTFLQQRLDEIIKVPYEVVDRLAGVRPTTRDRRMLIGQHPEYERLFVFTGLGGKGASQAPLGSQWLAELVCDGAPPPPEVDIQRFPPASAH